MLSRLLWVFLKLFVTCEDSFVSVFSIKTSLPIGNPRIFMPSVVSLLLVNCDRHSCNVFCDVCGRNGATDLLLMDVRILLLSLLRRSPMLFASV